MTKKEFYIRVIMDIQQKIIDDETTEERKRKACKQNIKRLQKALDNLEE